MNKNIHFMYESGKEPGESFAKTLVKAFGQSTRDSSDTIVSIGGDGLLLQALRLSDGKQVCGIRPPGSNSSGFWTNKNIANAKDLVHLFNQASRYSISPLKAKIEFADGFKAERYGFNDISIRAVHSTPPQELKEKFGLTDIDISLQSSLLNLSISFSDTVIGPHRIMGTGLIFATPFGSTAVNRNYGGPSVDIREDVIVLTGMGTTEPAKGFNSVSNNADTVFDIIVGSPHKRPVMVTFDSFGIINNTGQGPISKVRISRDKSKQTQLILTDAPGTRAYSAMMP